MHDRIAIDNTKSLFTQKRGNRTFSAQREAARTPLNYPQAAFRQERHSLPQKLLRYGLYATYRALQ